MAAQQSAAPEVQVAYYGSVLKKRTWKDNHVLVLRGLSELLHYRKRDELKEVIPLRGETSVHVVGRGEALHGRSFALRVISELGTRVFAFSSQTELARWHELIATAIASTKAAALATDADLLDLGLETNAWYLGTTAGKRRWKYHRLAIHGGGVTHYRTDNDVKEAFEVGPGDTVTFSEAGTFGRPNELVLVSNGHQRVFAFTSQDEGRLWALAVERGITGELESSRHRPANATDFATRLDSGSSSNSGVGFSVARCYEPCAVRQRNL
eukprot:Amastigsp_a846815_11.p1 type:complete len:268 gc:universal Amastigsp_a846815_11:89-892(+)